MRVIFILKDLLESILEGLNLGKFFQIFPILTATKKLRITPTPRLKGTGSQDGLEFCRHAYLDLGPKYSKGRDSF